MYPRNLPAVAGLNDEIPVEADGVDEDAQLMLALQRGEEGAFDVLFDRWAPRLLAFLGRMVGDRAVAEELLQETFLRVYRARERYSVDGRFSTWLFTIAANTARNELRRPFRRHVHQNVDPEPETQTHGGVLQLASTARRPDDLVEARMQRARVDAALSDLPPRQRAALWLCAVEGLSHVETGDVLGASAQSVKSLVHRARSALATVLSETATVAPPVDEIPTPASRRGER